MRHLIHLLFLACLLTACGGGSPTVTSTTVPLPTETPASTPTLYSGPWHLVAVHNVLLGQVKAFHTSDGGATWTSEPVPVTSGPVFLSRLEPLLTVLDGANIMTPDAVC